MGIESGGDLTPDGRGGADPDASSPAYLPRARLPIVATVLALCVGITFSLPWVTIEPFGISTSFTSMMGDPGWAGRLWADLMLLGFLVALISGFFDVFLRLGRGAAIAEALGFGAVGAGVVIGMASRFDSYFGNPGSGAWLCLIIAMTGAIAAVVRFASPDALAPTAPPYAAAYYAPPYPSTSYVAPVPPMSPAPDLPGAPGTLAVVQAGQTTTGLVNFGDLLIVGSDPGSSIVLVDPQVSPRHASIERRGPGWLVRSLDVANPIRVLDDTGRAHPVKGELGLRSGELLIGGAQVILYPPPP